MSTNDWLDPQQQPAARGSDAIEAVMRAIRNRGGYDLILVVNDSSLDAAGLMRKVTGDDKNVKRLFYPEIVLADGDGCNPVTLSEANLLMQMDYVIKSAQTTPCWMISGSVSVLLSLGVAIKHKLLPVHGVLVLYLEDEFAAPPAAKQSLTVLTFGVNGTLNPVSGQRERLVFAYTGSWVNILNGHGMKGDDK